MTTIDVKEDKEDECVSKREPSDDIDLSEVDHAPTKVSEEFEIWGKYTSVHGIPIIFRAPNWPLKIFWISLFLASSALCCYMLVNTFINYFNYEVVTKIRATPKKSLPFPSVTVCNTNFFATQEASNYVRQYLYDKHGLNATFMSYRDIIRYFREKNFSITVADEFENLRQVTFLKGKENITLAKMMGYSPDFVFYK